jgi:hypothetical protein
VGLGIDAFLARNTRYMKHVKELHFAACFHRDLRTRCPGGNGFGGSVNHGGLAHDKFFQILDSQLAPLFNLIEDDILQKFRFAIPFHIQSNPYADVDGAVGIWGPVCLGPS